MTPEDRSSFIEVVVGLAELKGKQLSAPALELYWRAMQHWDIADFRQAAQHLVRTCQFMPMPFDFEQLRKAGCQTAGEAWSVAIKSIGSCYHAGHLNGGGTSGDELIDRAVCALGGYAAIAQCDSNKLHFLERRFAENYEQIRDAEDVRATLPRIAGPPRLIREPGLRFVEKLLPGPQS